MSKKAKGGPLTNCFCIRKFGRFYILRIILGLGKATDLRIGSFDAPFKALQGGIQCISSAYALLAEFSKNRSPNAIKCFQIRFWGLPIIFRKTKLDDMHFWAMPYMSRIGWSANKPRLGLSILSGPRIAIGSDCQKSKFFTFKAHISINIEHRTI